MILHVRSNSRKVDGNWDTEGCQDGLVPNPAELEDMRRLDGTIMNNKERGELARDERYVPRREDRLLSDVHFVYLPLMLELDRCGDDRTVPTRGHDAEDVSIGEDFEIGSVESGNEVSL